MRIPRLRRSTVVLAASGLLSTIPIVTSVPLGAAPALAAANTFYFHGTPADQANKATPPGTATFNTSPPTGTVPVTQTTSPLANRDFAGNPLAAYWSGMYTNSNLGGEAIQLTWYWSSSNAEAVLLGLDMDMTIFGDPNFSMNTGTILGRATVHLNVGATPTVNTSLVPVAGAVTNTLLIQTVPHFADTGQGALVYYDATSTPSGFTFITAPSGPAVVFDTTTKVAFAPATIVSPSFLGGEPEVTTERQIPGSQLGRIDNDRIFVDWPLSSRTQTSQVSRSINGGDKFRLLLDLTTCPQRNRPNCQTGGGGDSKTDVNLYNGNLYFADQEVLVNEAVASSTDHGDSWPALRQFAISNGATAVDRQWVAYIDPSVVTVGTRHVEAFLAYHVPLVGQYIQGIDQDGLPIAQPVTQIVGVSQSGSLRVDNSSGPAHGWIYQPYRGGGGVTVATAYGPGYQVPTNWQSTTVSSDTASIFPWLQIDSHGNAYLVWVRQGNLFLSVSPIDDSRNNPAAGGRPGAFWTPQAQLNPPGVTSTVLPEVTAGDTGRIAITFMGSTDCVGLSDNCPDTATWNTYVEVISDALALVRGTPLSVASGIVNHRIDHRGQVCTSGTTCTKDRSLLDMMDIGFDASGRVGVVFMDNNNQLAAGPTHTATSKNGPFAQYAKETLGPALLAAQPAINISIPQNSRADTAGDATWPNTAAGTNLRSLDFLGASIGLSADGSQLVAKLRVSDASLGGMRRDLAAYNASTTEPGARLQYVARFMTGEDVYHLDMDFQPGRSPEVRFFGGLLDSDDAVQNGTGATVGARYVADPGFTVTGSIRDGVITLMTPKAQFAVDTGTALFSVTGFSLAGPSERDTTATLIANSMRTIDATPPFDATLQTVQSPPGGETCNDGAVRKHHGWHDVPDSRAQNGSQCREVRNGSSGDDMEVDFFGRGADVIIARGPRGGSFNMSIDGGAPVSVSEYRPPTNPSNPDTTGRIDLDFNIPVHINAATTGYHTLRIDVVNNSTDPTRNMLYVDGFEFYGGEGVGAPTTATDVSTLLNGTLAALLGAEYTVLTTANTIDLNFVLEAIPGTTLTLKDPTGTVVASGTVQDGVLALHFGPNGIGAYTVDVRNTTAGQIAFNLWEVVAGN
jgi:hypothetical protein